MKKNVWNYVCGIYLLFYAIASIVIFAASAKYLFYTFSLYAELGLSTGMDQYAAVIDGLMCLQLLLTFFSGIIGIFAFVKRISGKWLIASGCFGVVSKGLYVAARIASMLYGNRITGAGFCATALLDCCLPMIYIPFSVAALAIGISQVKKEEAYQCGVWFPFFHWKYTLSHDVAPRQDKTLGYDKDNRTTAISYDGNSNRV